MGKKAKHAEEHVNHERWLVSYADFITLLFAFFVVLFSSAPKEDTNTRTIAAASQNSFSTFSIFRGGGSKIHGKRMKSPGDGIELQPEDQTPLATEPKDIKAEVDRQRNMTTANQKFELTSRMRDSMIQEFFKDLLDKNNMNVSMESRGLVVSFNDVAFFDEGSSKAKEGMKKTLDKIIKVVGKRKNMIQIEGHSDGTEKDRGSYESNMEMSYQRALHVAKTMVKDYDVPADYVAVIGYGSFRPQGDTGTKDGRAKNRRVDIVLLKSEPDSNKMALPSFDEEKDEMLKTQKAKEEETLAVESLIE
ncbi:MAG: OmpA family protein [Deltaproteobacteria bacterium]|nr:OmpA family protein [Deltaproteobacteria bacterium]